MKRTALLIILYLMCHVAHAADIVWFDGTNPITYSIPKDVEPVVKIALDMWKSDMQQVTGMTPQASSKGTIKVVQGRGIADGFRIYVKGKQIIVEGHGGRGMAYGLLELSRMWYPRRKHALRSTIVSLLSSNPVSPIVAYS